MKFAREKLWSGATLVTLRLFGGELDLKWNWHDRVRQNSRAYVSVGWAKGNTDLGILFQHYRKGFDFTSHTDGPKSNRVLTLVLKRPKRGGEFFCEGPHDKWLGGRIIRFDGGRDPHGVTAIEQGSRSVLMFQSARWR